MVVILMSIYHIVNLCMNVVCTRYSVFVSRILLSRVLGAHRYYGSYLSRP